MQNAQQVNALRSAPIAVFIVEDHTEVRKCFVSMLECRGSFRVVGEAGTPGEAIEGILRTHPDVVVLDIHLLGGNGLEVMCRVRLLEPGIQFVAMTNQPSAPYRKAFMAAGAHCVLDKSTEFLKLPETLVAAAAGARRIAAESSAPQMRQSQAKGH